MDVINPENGLLPLSRLPWQGPMQIKSDQKTHWVAELLSELAQDVEDEIAMVGEESIGVSIDLTFEKKRHPQYGEIVLAQGLVQSTFPTLCSQTGALMLDDVVADVNACFLHENQKKESTDPLEEEIEIVIGEEVYDLYFYVPKGAPIKEMVHEYLFLNKNPYPKLSES